MLNEEAFAEFDEFRNSSAKLRKGWSELAKKKARNLLGKHSHEDQQAMVDYSIIGGYTGLYPPRKAPAPINGASHKLFKEDSLRTSSEDRAKADADLRRLQSLIEARQ